MQASDVLIIVANRCVWVLCDQLIGESIFANATALLILIPAIWLVFGADRSIA